MPKETLPSDTEESPRNSCCRPTFWTAFFMGSANAVVLGLIAWAIIALI
jgi:hypothetical protein